MNKVTMDNMAVDLIEQAKQMSKEKFLVFVEEVYGVNRDAWKHLWKVPIVATYKTKAIFPAELHSISRKNLLAVLRKCIKDEIGDSRAVFVPYENIISSLPEEAAREYEERISDGSISEDYNAVIVYDESRLKTDYRENVIEGKKANSPRTQEQINEIYLGLVSTMFLHERFHLNTNAMVIDIAEPDLLNSVNGMERICKNDDIGYMYTQNNEVLVDTMAKIVQTYSKGDTVEDCLYKIIESRGKKSGYKEYDDRLVLSLFTLFPDEISRCMMFEAYGKRHDNLLERKHIEVFGGNNILRRHDMLKKVGEYFNKTASTTMTTEQFTRRKKMLEMIGVKNIGFQQAKAIDRKQFKDAATLESAMRQLPASLQTIMLAYRKQRIASELDQDPNKKEIE